MIDINQATRHKNAKIIDIQKLDKTATSIDTTVYWAEYKVDFDEISSLYKIEDIKYNIDKVCSSDEILITKKNKKGFEKTINIKNSIKSYRFENSCLFIVLKTGQQGEIPTVRIDDFLKLVGVNSSDTTRTRFFDKDMKEL